METLSRRTDSKLPFASRVLHSRHCANPSGGAWRAGRSAASPVTRIQMQALCFLPVPLWASHLISPAFSPLACRMQVVIIVLGVVWWGGNERMDAKSSARCPARRKRSVVSAIMIIHMRVSQ